MADAKKGAAFLDKERPAIVGRGAHDLLPQLRELWKKGLPPGDDTGWRSLDALYTVAPGQLTIVTGWPSSGKSEWLDALLLNLAMQGWRHVLFSAENKPDEIHAAKMLEKYLKKPFRDGPRPRMTEDEVDEGAAKIAEWFTFLGPAPDVEREVFPIDDVMMAAEARFRELGMWDDRTARKGVVIDPWNELEHLRPRQYSETEYISYTLSKVRAWAREHQIHVWIVAHPQKLARENGKLPIPRPDTISGSQHWWNKADNCITVWREFGEHASPDVTIYVQKVRFKHIGKQGSTVLKYDIVTGRYTESEAAWTGLSRVVG